MKKINHSDRSHRATSALMTVICYEFGAKNSAAGFIFGRQLLAMDGDDIIAPPDFPQAIHDYCILLTDYTIGTEITTTDLHRKVFP